MTSLFETIRLILIGAFGFLGLVEVWLLLTRRDRMHAVGAFAATIVVGFLAARVMNYMPVGDPTILFVSRAQYAALAMLAAVGFWAAQILEPARWRLFTGGLTGLALLVAALCFVDGPIMRDEVVQVEAAYGVMLRTTGLAPSGWLFFSPLIVGAVVVFSLLRRAHQNSLQSRQLMLLRAAGVLLAAAGTNDMLRAMGLVQTIELLDLAFGVVGIGLAGLLTHHAEMSVKRLEDTVEARTRDYAETVESLNGLLLGLPDIVLLVRSDGIQLYNETAQARFEGTGQVRFTPADLGANPSDVRALERIRQLAPGDEAVCVRVKLRSAPAARPFQCEIVAVAVSLGSERVVVATARDLSERIELERRLRRADRLSSVGTLASGIAHEINNPLTYVAANVQYVASHVARTRPPEEVVEAMDDALEGVERVTDIVQQLRLFGRADSDSESQTTPLEAPLGFAMRLAGHRLRHRAQVVLECPSDVPDVRGDDGKLSQVFVNLLTNAGDSMPEDRDVAQNRVEVRVTVGAEFVEVRVADNGRGMTPDELDHALDPFFSTKDVDRGTGLGLSICHGIVEEIGGDLTLESQIDGGTVARVLLPLARGQSAEPDAGQQDPPLRPLGRLLLIDDDVLVLKAMRRMLKDEYRVSMFVSAREAVGEIEDGAEYDAILCDVMMPEMNGEQFLEWLRQHRPALAERLIFVTAGGVGVNEHAAAVPVVRKPVEWTTLQTALTHVVPASAG